MLAVTYHPQMSQQSREFCCRGLWRCLLCTDTIPKLESVTVLVIEEKLLIISLLNVGQVG